MKIASLYVISLLIFVSITIGNPPSIEVVLDWIELSNLHDIDLSLLESLQRIHVKRPYFEKYFSLSKNLSEFLHQRICSVVLNCVWPAPRMVRVAQKKKALWITLHDSSRNFLIVCIWIIIKLQWYIYPTIVLYCKHTTFYFKM